MNPAAQALQEVTASAAQAMLAWLGTPMSWHGDRLSHAGGFAAQMHLECTAWWPAVVLVVALALFGAAASVPARRLGWAMVAGVVVVILANQLRLVVVLWSGVHAPGIFAWMHEFVGPLWLVAAGAAVVAATVRGAARGDLASRAAAV